LGLPFASCGTFTEHLKVVKEGAAGGTTYAVLNLTAETVIQAIDLPMRRKACRLSFRVPPEAVPACAGPGRLPSPTLEVQNAGLTRLSCGCPPQMNPGPMKIGVGDVVLLARHVAAGIG